MTPKEHLEKCKADLREAYWMEFEGTEPFPWKPVTKPPLDGFGFNELLLAVHALAYAPKGMNVRSILKEMNLTWGSYQRYRAILRVWLQDGCPRWTEGTDKEIRKRYNNRKLMGRLNVSYEPPEWETIDHQIRESLSTLKEKYEQQL